ADGGSGISNGKVAECAKGCARYAAETGRYGPGGRAAADAFTASGSDAFAASAAAAAGCVTGAGGGMRRAAGHGSGSTAMTGTSCGMIGCAAGTSHGRGPSAAAAYEPFSAALWNRRAAHAAALPPLR